MQGRWLSPDPYLGSMDLTNPQSFNRYAYALNNPLSFTDPNGLDCVYFNDAGDGLDSIDAMTDSGGCADSGGTWINGTVDPNSVTYDPGSDTFNISSGQTNSDGSITYYNSNAAANGPWFDPNQGQTVDVHNGVLDQSAFS